MRIVQPARTSEEPAVHADRYERVARRHLAEEARRSEVPKRRVVMAALEEYLDLER